MGYLDYYITTTRSCCEKDSYHGKQACIMRRQYYYGDVFSKWVGLAYDTSDLKGNHFLELQNDKYHMIGPSYTKGRP